MVALAPVQVVTGSTGRGAWPTSGRGGTLSVDGKKPGGYYRAPAAAGLAMPGRAGFDAVKTGRVGVDDYAVYLAVVAVQRKLGVASDGLWGTATGKALVVFQQLEGLKADGVMGPATAKRLFRPVIAAAARAVSSNPRLPYVAGGHIAWESGFDPGAVGGVSPQDLGLGQINGPSHPDMSAADRLNPDVAIPYVVGLVRDNLAAFSRESDGVAAYNLGRAGARSWIQAGRPTMWGSTNVPKYIQAVYAAAATV